MIPQDVMTWLRPVESWIKSNVVVESDPEERWHQAATAWTMVTECFGDCAEGENPIWKFEGFTMEMEVKDANKPLRKTREDTAEVHPVCLDKFTGEPFEESDKGESSEVLRDDTEELVSDDNTSDVD